MKYNPDPDMMYDDSRNESARLATYAELVCDMANRIADEDALDDLTDSERAEMAMLWKVFIANGTDLSLDIARRDMALLMANIKLRQAEAMLIKQQAMQRFYARAT